MPPVISAQHLRKTYKDFVAVADASFEVEEGEIFGLLGSNGAGKTTSVECLQGLRHADGGKLRVLGLDPRAQSRELRRRIGAQLQESALPDHIRVWEALDLFSAITPGGHDWRELMEEWGLGDKRKASYHGLSGGQRQRLFIALALVNGPEVVFLDEMTTGLDPASRREAWGLIERVRDHGTTVVIVTHFMDEAERLCDRVVVIDQHRVIATGSPAELIARSRRVGTVTFSTDDDVSFLDDVPGVDHVSRAAAKITVTGTGPLLALVAAALVERGIVPADLDGHRASLEDVYLDLTTGEH